MGEMCVWKYGFHHRDEATEVQALVMTESRRMYFNGCLCRTLTSVTTIWVKSPTDNTIVTKNFNICFSSHNDIFVTKRFFVCLLTNWHAGTEYCWQMIAVLLIGNLLLLKSNLHSNQHLLPLESLHSTSNIHILFSNISTIRREVDIRVWVYL